MSPSHQKPHGLVREGSQKTPREGQAARDTGQSSRTAKGQEGGITEYVVKMTSQIGGNRNDDLINPTDIIVAYYEKYHVQLGFHLIL